jgi:hypothetical protein
MSVLEQKDVTTSADNVPKECERLCHLIDDNGLKKLLRAFEDLEAQIKNRPLLVWEMKVVAASTMEHLEKMTDTIIAPDFTPVD